MSTPSTKASFSLKRAIAGLRKRSLLRTRRALYRLAGARQELILSPHYRGLQGLITVRREAAILWRNKRRFKAIADPAKILWVNPGSIDSKLNYDLDICFNAILPGDWDVLRRASLENVAKHRSIRQRFVQGLAWKDTDVFKTKYAKRFARGDRIRGAATPDELASRYCVQIDTLFDDMKRNGFRISRNQIGQLEGLPHLHIGRNGELILGNNGNHRIAIAKVLGIQSVPCWVRGRHLMWQQIRETIAEAMINSSTIGPNFPFTRHPDLTDLLEPSANKPHD